jgi:hypothetical protein
MSTPRPLISDISNGRCLPFIGAGFSKNAIVPPGRVMPDWNELTTILAQDAGTKPGTAPPVVAQRYEQRFGRVQLVEAVRIALLGNEARPGKAHRAFARLPFYTVYTTNFDVLLEDAYAEEHRPFRSLVGELQLPFHAGRLASSIVKMHGDLRHEEHIILTENDYSGFMTRYPVVATHLSAMLITRTPLFIGYSLSDPDFQHVRRVVRERLGAFERMAYVVQFDVEHDAIEKALDQKIHIVSLQTKHGTGHDEALASFFDSIQQRLDGVAVQNLRTSRPDVFEDLEPTRLAMAAVAIDEAPILEATSNLCFVLMPFAKQFDEIYRGLIQPVAAAHGLAVLRADEMAGSGFILEQIRAAIAQARIIVADVTDGNPNVLYELGQAQALKKPLVLIARENSKLPFDLAHQRIPLYGSAPGKARDILGSAFLFVLRDEQLAESTKLLEIGSYTGAVATATIVLEHKLREILKDVAVSGGPMVGMSRMLSALQKGRLVNASLLGRLKQAVRIRNAAVHGARRPSQDDAKFVVSAVQNLIDLFGKPPRPGRRRLDDG